MPTIDRTITARTPLVKAWESISDFRTTERGAHRR